MVEFKSEFYQQISTTARPYASIFMDYIETEFLKSQEIKPCVWKDSSMILFFIQTNTEENLDRFQEDLNKFHPNLLFTYEKSREKLNFFDAVIKIKEGEIAINLLCKPADGHQYLYYDCYHAEHIKISIFFSQTLRLKRICYEKK